MRRKRKRNKGEDIVGPAVDKDVDHEAVGLKQATLTAKEIPMIKKNNPVLQVIIYSLKTNYGLLLFFLIMFSDAVRLICRSK